MNNLPIKNHSITNKSIETTNPETTVVTIKFFGLDDEDTLNTVKSSLDIQCLLLELMKTSSFFVANGIFIGFSRFFNLGRSKHCLQCIQPTFTFTRSHTVDAHCHTVTAGHSTDAYASDEYLKVKKI
ncbi:hypothetical protein CAEBREN_20751 [Caenorhabditis brenneri]|uniref:Uncharacterized protein n=1 Tax=Caenorhabditis brenneri TaxID=135651 RepID=G0P3R8_CAEBE|nr:hypothetical protein CAEBREN_20751 [Caenorhabditis brenneri]